MNYYNVFYWLTVANGIKQVFDVFSNFFTFFTAVSLVVYLFVIGACLDALSTKGKDSEDYKIFMAWRKFLGRVYLYCQIICIVTWIGYVATPTKKDCLLIVAGGAVGNFITTDSSAKQLPSDVTKFLHLSLNKEIEDLSTETKEDIKKELGVQTPKEKLLDEVKTLTKEQIIDYLQKDTTISIKNK